jgi:putative copper export protein
VILEYLQPDPDAVEGALVLARGGYNAATLAAAGLTLFTVGFGHRLTPDVDRPVRRMIGAAVALALALSAIALALRAVVLGGAEGLTDPAIWGELLRSRNGDAILLRASGLVAMLGLLTVWRAGPALGAVGAVVAVGSFAAVGHSTSIAPRQEIVALLVAHLMAVAFWVGSLPALARLAGRGDATSARTIEDWSRVAIGAVVTMLVTAGLLVWFLKGEGTVDLGWWYDRTILAKLGLVAAGLGLAALNRARLTPAFVRGEVGAGDRLARAVRLEFVVLLAVFFAASELVSVHPNPPKPVDAAHTGSVAG